MTAGCAGGGIDVPVGPANLRAAERVSSPRAFRALPAWAIAAGTPPAAVDARMHDDVVWILRRYRLRVTAAREAGHRTHGDGTAIDLVPADGTTQAVWDASAGRLAHDLGWSPACARSGTRPACRLAPAIQFVGYDGYPSHGSPRTCARRLPGAPAHLVGLAVLRHERPDPAVRMGRRVPQRPSRRLRRGGQFSTGTTGSILERP